MTRLHGRAVQALHRLLRDCIDVMGIGVNMPRSDHVAEEGQALPAALAGSLAAKDLGDVRCGPLPSTGARTRS